MARLPYEGMIDKIELKMYTPPKREKILIEAIER